MGIRLLGTLEVVDADGVALDIGGAQPRTILALLAAAGGRVVSVDALVDAIWGESPPASAAGTLHSYISRLRRALRVVDVPILRDPAGYRLAAGADDVDMTRFEALADAGRAALEAGDPARARDLLADAEQLWRGPALLEVRDRPRLTGIARRLDDRRLAATEDRLAAELALGRHAALVGELAQLTDEHPLREGLWELLALARYRSGMQADALRAIAEAREVLVEGLGVEPGARLRDLERAILDQDPRLDPLPRPDPRPNADPEPVGPPPPEPSHDPPGRVPLVGRAAELGPLRRAFATAVGGRPGVAIVRGEAGVGKTRLVEELAHEATGQGCRVVWGRCLEGGVAPAHWPWLSVVRPLRGDDPHAGGDEIGQLLDATGAVGPTPPPAVASGDRSVLLDGVLDLLGRSVEDQPLLVVIEDLQWADPESVELATQVASGLTTGRVLLVLTLREGEDTTSDGVLALLAAASRRSGTCHLHLRGLPAEATTELLTQVSGRTVDDGLARAVHERTDGNPFYAIELQRLLDAEGAVDRASAARVAVPVGVRDVVRQRLARLPSTTIELLSVAAVAGRDLDVELVAGAAGRTVDACLDDLDVAIEHRLLVENGPGLRFSHALVREVVVDELSPVRRARTHLAVADALQALGRDEAQAEVVAEHLWAAAPIGAGRRAADALDRAAAVAIGRFAVATASDLLGRALELRRTAGHDPAAELATLVSLVWALRARGGYQGPVDHYARAAHLAEGLGRHDVALEMQWAEWAGHDTACDFDRARPVAGRFRDRAAASEDPMVRVAGDTAWAIQCWHDGDLVAAADAFARVAQARAALAPDDLSLAAELIVLSTAFGLYIDEQVGRLDDPEAAFAAAAAAVDGNFPVAIIWCLACTSATSAGDLDRLERCCRRVLDAEAGETLGFWGSQARMYLGAVLVATGRAEEGRALFTTGHDGYLGAGMRTGLALMLAAAASAEVAAGDIARATHHLERAQQELDRGEGWPVPYVLLAAADVAEATGAPAAEVARLRAEAATRARHQGAVVAAARAQVAAGGQRWFGPARPAAAAPATAARTSASASQEPAITSA